MSLAVNGPSISSATPANKFSVPIPEPIGEAFDIIIADDGYAYESYEFYGEDGTDPQRVLNIWERLGVFRVSSSGTTNEIPQYTVNNAISQQMDLVDAANDLEIFLNQLGALPGSGRFRRYTVGQAVNYLNGQDQRWNQSGKNIVSHLWQITPTGGNNVNFFAVLIKFALAFAAVCSAQAQVLASAGTEEYTARATQLLRELFPSLKDAQVLIQFKASLANSNPLYKRGAFTLALSQSYEPTLSTPFHTDHFFDSLFWFSVGDPQGLYGKDGQLMELMNYGPFISGRLDRLTKKLNAHHRWSDAQLVAALKAAGAKFGPDDRDAFLRSLPLKVLEPLTGRLEIVQATFWPRDASPSNNVDLTWTVEAKWRSDDGRYEARYFLYFEPFEGALTSIDFRWPRPVE